MLKNFLVMQLDTNYEMLQDGALPHYHRGCDMVPEVNLSRKMNRLWQQHSTATQITQSNITGLLLLGVCERQSVHTTQLALSSYFTTYHIM